MELGFDKRTSVFRWVIYFALWTAIGMFWAVRWYLLYVNHPTLPIGWGQSITLGLVEWYLWALFAILIFRLCPRLPLDRKHWIKSVSYHLLLGAAISILHLFLYSAADGPIDDYFMASVEGYVREGTFADTYWYFLRSKFHGAMMTYVLIALISYAIGFYQRFRAEELHASELRAQLAGAHLDALKAQLQPHFLFNTLHAISSLMHEDVDAADRMVGRLSDLLRIVLKRVGEQKILLEEELEFARGYLDIERVRFSDRMRVEIAVDEAVSTALVPNLILQPLVENAVRHGIANNSGGGVVRISAHRNGESLHLQIADDGPGLVKDTGSSRGEGIGLTNTRERLKQLYGNRHQLELRNGAGRGFAVSITIPFERKQITSTHSVV